MREEDDHLHLPKNFKAVHLVQQLHQSSLNLPDQYYLQNSSSFLEHPRPSFYLQDNIQDLHFTFKSSTLKKAFTLFFSPVSTSAFAESSSTNSINLVHENDTGLVISCIVEHLSDQPGRLSNVLVHNGA